MFYAFVTAQYGKKVAEGIATRQEYVLRTDSHDDPFCQACRVADFAGAIIGAVALADIVGGRRIPSGGVASNRIMPRASYDKRCCETGQFRQICARQSHESEDTVQIG